MLTHMPAETREQLLMEHPSVFGWCAYQNGVGHIVQDHERVIRKGYAQIKAEAEAALLALDLTQPESIQKEAFLRAELIVCDAVIAFGRRYAQEAKTLAAKEKDESRRAELEEIARICSRVPEHAAQTFQESVQFLWFIELITQIETNGVSISPGRFDQYMYPFYKEDIEKGRLDEDEALDIIECLWIKLSEMVILYDKIMASFIDTMAL